MRSQFPKWKDEYEYDEIAVITAGDGVGVGKVFHYVEGKYALHQRAYRIHIMHDNLSAKFFFYYIQSRLYSYLSKEKYNGSVSSLRRPMLEKFPVCMPSMKKQNEIVDKLDRFQVFTDSLTKGLPAEIEARKKQYEYYRDKLLSFQPVRKS